MLEKRRPSMTVLLGVNGAASSELSRGDAPIVTTWANLERPGWFRGKHGATAKPPDRPFELICQATRSKRRIFALARHCTSIPLRGTKAHPHVSNSQPSTADSLRHFSVRGPRRSIPKAHAAKDSVGLMHQVGTAGGAGKLGDSQGEGRHPLSFGILRTSIRSESPFRVLTHSGPQQQSIMLRSKLLFPGAALALACGAHA